MTSRLSSDIPGQLRLEMHNESDTTTFREVNRDGDNVTLRLEVTGGRPAKPQFCSEIRAALLKMAVEFLWLTDPELAAGDELEHARRIVMGEKADGLVIIGRRGDPTHREVSVTHDAVETGDGRCRLWVHALIYGVFLATDSRLTESDGLHGEFDVWPIAAADC